MEFWGIEVKSGETFEVVLGDDKISLLSQACLGETKKNKSESVCLHINVEGEKLVLGTLHSERLPQQLLHLVLDKTFTLSHNWKNGSVYFYEYQPSRDTGMDSEEDSEEEEEAIQLPIPNGKQESKKEVEETKKEEKSVAADKKDAKQVTIVEPGKDDEDDSDDSDSDDSDDSDDSGSDEEGVGKDMSDDSDDGSDEEEETPKKPQSGNKRQNESAIKTPTTDKKARMTPPRKTDGKKAAVHVATPHPSKKPDAKTAGNESNQKSPASAPDGAHSCKSCNRPEQASRRNVSVKWVHSRSVMAAAPEENIRSPKAHLGKVFEESLRITLPDEAEVAPIIAPCARKEAGDYQCNNAMSLWSKIKGKEGIPFKGPQSVGKAIMENLRPTDMIESCSVAGPGFIIVTLSRQWIAHSIQRMLTYGIDTWAPRLPVKRAIVDFSSPNIAKEMHVGHLRSTIIGDTLARMLEYSKVEVLRRNHVGDWGTQFGMLIEYLFERYPDGKVNDQDIGELEAFYKASKERFDDDAEFKARAQQAVVRLQGGDVRYRKAWTQICEISRNGFEKVYQSLGTRLEEKGESFYNPFIPHTLDLLRKQNLIEESEGAQVIFIEGKEIPLIVVKSDGGFNYASTDLAALWYRLNEEKAEWIIYVTDVGQRDHFDMFFTAAKRAGWLPAGEGQYPRISHVAFGLVLGDNRKRFRTRSTEVVKLVDLLDEAKTRCKAALVERGKAAEWTAEELELTAEAVGYGAVKYADLKNNRLTDYTFNFDQMLNDKGNTAVYLLYAHARICSIIRKSGRDIEALKKEGQLILENDVECKLGLHLLQFAEVVEEACTNLLPNVLCEYLYELSEKFTSFYSTFKVVGSREESSRLLLCEATVVVMRKCFHLLGITPVYKI